MPSLRYVLGVVNSSSSRLHHPSQYCITASILYWDRRRRAEHCNVPAQIPQPLRQAQKVRVDVAEQGMEQDVSGRAQEKEYLHAHLKAFTFVANAPVEAQQVPQCRCRLCSEMKRLKLSTSCA